MSQQQHSASATPSAAAGNAKSAAQRLQRELMDLMTNAVDGVTAFPHDDNIFHWVGTIQGADSTAYEGLEFELHLRFSANYPFEPPLVTFATPCFHPNVDTQGGICLDILKENWSAVYTASQVLLSIQSLLDNPNNASPLNPTAAGMWKDPVEFRKAVRMTYASAGASGKTSTVDVTLSS